MNPYINRALAQQIVDTVKDLCGQNVNFIDCSGMIFASTDKDRIGSFHEIGRQAAESGSVIEVNENDHFTGTQQGVNLPIYHNHSVIAVIGITGDPDKIKKYAHLAERITRLLIREKELDAFSRTEAEKKSYVLRRLLDQEEIHPQYLEENLKKWGISENASYHLLRVQVQNHTGVPENAVLEPRLHQLFLKLNITLYTFLYPDQYVAVLEHSVFLSRKQLLKAFAEDHSLVRIALGNAAPIRQISDSALAASAALKSLEHKTENYAEYDELTLDLIFSSVDQKTRESFLKKTLGSLPQKDRELLEIYFDCGMSLKNTCEKTFLHKNTLQYRLNQIHQRCGYNPRRFQDAVLLYLALKL